MTTITYFPEITFNKNMLLASNMFIPYSYDMPDTDTQIVSNIVSDIKEIFIVVNLQQQQITYLKEQNDILNNILKSLTNNTLLP
jgi:hypothetical protein